MVEVLTGVQPVIIGARTLEQLDGNLKALDLTLMPEQIASLNAVSKPALNFPADFLALSPSFCHAGSHSQWRPESSDTSGTQGRQRPLLIQRSKKGELV
jgi:hypothetical protein